MKILCISDTEMPQLENAANLRRHYSDIELVVSCGDLHRSYLEFVTSILNVPLFYEEGAFMIRLNCPVCMNTSLLFFG